MKQIAILGSTGSIGRQALDVIASHPDEYEVYALTANNSVDLLIEQALKFKPEAVVIANEEHYGKLRDALAGQPVKVYAGAAIDLGLGEAAVAVVADANVPPHLPPVDFSRAEV